MRAVQIALTLVEVLALVAVLVGYLVAIERSLRRTVSHLARVAFGVRAIEQQCSRIGPGLRQVGGRLADVAERLQDVAAAADAGAKRG